MCTFSAPQCINTDGNTQKAKKTEKISNAQRVMLRPGLGAGECAGLFVYM